VRVHADLAAGWRRARRAWQRAYLCARCSAAETTPPTSKELRPLMHTPTASTLSNDLAIGLRARGSVARISGQRASR
jgi:hypothetical protein